MRRPLIIASLAAALAAAPALAEMPKDMPKRKTGLWELKTTMAEMGGMTQTFEMCVGPDTDNLLQQQGQGKSDCDQQSWTRNGERIDFSATCRYEGTTATMRGRFSGDFTTRYSGEFVTTYSPPMQGMASTTMKQEARWTGACRAGQKPGDVVMKGMGAMNIEEMMKNMPKR